MKMFGKEFVVFRSLLISNMPANMEYIKLVIRYTLNFERCDAVKILF